MLSLSKLFPPGREEGLKRLHAFVPHAGRVYAASRNADLGSGLRQNVSMLSPYIRYRLITEREVVAAVLAQHTPEQAEKFIQEVFWRTYWKGWLQMRPQVWTDFLVERDTERARVGQSAELQKALADAEAGRTGIECFDDWVRELRTSGYLHNHTRMWFASIWIFTLKLPWVLGADFFLRYLIDADPASNTLSWRWVAGIQTRGKTYLARPDNIAKYTQGRYQPTDLATQAPPIRQEAPYPARPIEPLDPIPKRSRVLVLLHGEDLHGFEALPAGLDIVGTAVAAGNNHACRWPFGNKAKVFIHAAVADVTSQMESTLRADVRMIDSLNPHELAEQAQTLDVQCIVTPDAPVGPIDSGLQLLTHALDQHGISLKRFRRAWDHAAWPYAEKGFFPFKKRIPELLQQADLV